MIEIFTMIYITIIGAIMGSFLGCMGYRIPNKIKTTYPSSFCNDCGKPLKWYMNIPIISYIALGGKCAYCKKPINFIYPFVEIACALLFLCNYLTFGFNMNFFISTIITCALMVTIVSDFLYFYISDRVLIISGLAIVITLFIFMYLIKLLGNAIFRKESLGDGDIKLMGIVGLSIGIMNSLVSLFIASVVGLLFSFIITKKNKEGIIPFGPFLLIGALITLYFSDVITPFLQMYF